MKKRFLITTLVLVVFLALTAMAANAEGESGITVTKINYIEQLPEEWVEGQPLGSLRSWNESKHAQVGVTCAVCHGDDPQNLKTPTPSTCAVCHAQQAAEFATSTHATSVTHAMSKNSTTYNGITVDYKWQAYPEGGPDKWGCENCHSIGRVNEDGMNGDCSTCHSAHTFSLEQARSPETCSGCHAGPGHPQYESYMDSRHGAIYQTKKDEWDLSGSTAEFWARQEVDPLEAPTCTTCHMPYGTHYTSGGMAHDLNGGKNEDFEEQITWMVDNSCTVCHTESYAREWLGNADDMATYTLGRMKEAKAMLEALRKDGLIRQTMEVTNGHPIAGQLSGVECLFFRVNMDTNRCRKGAYHMSTQWAGRQGWTDQSFDLMEFRSEVERLRSDAERDAKIQELEELIEALENR